MPLSFPHASLLALSQESRFFGAGLNYSNVKRLTINGNVTDLNNTFGVSGIWDGSQGVLATIAKNVNFQPLVINGYSFGSGRIQSLSFSPGIDVKTKTYTADLLVYDSGDLTNLTGQYYNGINSSNWQYLQDFSEGYAFTSKENGGYSYVHSANIRFNSGVGNLNAIDTAKSLARSLFTGSNLGIAFYSGYTNVSGKRYHKETYDTISNECSFEETFDFDTYQDSYSVTRTNQIQIDINGIASASENGQIRGLQEPTYAGAIGAVSSEMTGAFGRCNTLFQLYGTATDAYPLNSQPIVSSRSIDPFGGTAAYSVTFTNDISNSGSFTWDYTQSLTYADGFNKMQEAGSVIGKGFHTSGAYAAAVLGYTDHVKSTAGSRANSFFSSFAPQSFANYTVFQESQTERHSPVRGSIDYQYDFSNEPIIFGNAGIKSIEVSRQDNLPITLNSAFDIFNKGVIVQDQKTNTIGGEAISLNVLGYPFTPLSSYLSNAKDVCNSLVNTLSGYSPAAEGPGYFASDARYNFRPNENVLSVTVNYRYNSTS